MIKITKEFTLENVVGEFTYEWVLPDCITLISSVVVDTTITATFDFCDNNCLLDSNLIGLTIKSSDGCITEIESIFNNVCKDFAFTQGGIVPLEDCDGCTIAYKAPVNDINGVYNWTYDEDIFTASLLGNRIYLTYKDNIEVTVTSTPLSVVVNNEYGCTLEDTLPLPICSYESLKFDFELVCSGDRDGNFAYVTPKLTPLNSPCGLELDYRTTTILSVLNIDSSYLTLSTGADYVKVILDGISPNSTIVVELQTKDCTGFPYIYTLCLAPRPCSDVPNINNFEHTFGCEECADTTKFRPVNSSREEDCSSNLSINLEDLIEGDIDWSTFTFVPRTGQTLNGSTSLTTPHGDANLDINRNVLFTYTGGLVNTEVVEYRIEINGVETFGVLNFKGTRCGDTPVAIDLEVCVLSDSQTDYIDITANDSGDIAELIIVEYPQVQTLVNGFNVKFIPNGYIGTTVLKYRVKSSTGVESNIARVAITSINADITTTDLSVCLGDILDLNTLVDDNTGMPWSFVGFTTEVSDIPGDLDSSTFSVGDVISNPAITLSEAGIFTFQYGEIGTCNAYTTVNVEVIDDNAQVDLTVAVCNSTADSYNLNELTNLTDGTWTDLNQTNVLDVDGVTVYSTIPTGAYMFRYNKVSTGIYNTTTCNNTFILTLDMQSELEDVAPICLSYCSYGPNPELDLDCKTNPIVLNSEPTTGCEYDLYEQVGLPTGSKIQLLNAPFTPIYLHINGMDLLLTTGSFLPEGQAIWANGDAPLGTYVFRAFYGDACTKEVDFEVNIYAASCQLESDTITKCNSDNAFNIFTELTGSSSCLDNNITGLTLISENLTGTGTVDYNLTTGDFTPGAPGQWVFGFTSTVIGTDGTCSACNVDATITVIVTPIPGPGVPQPGTVCNDGTCVVDVYPDMFIANQTILGTFCFDGFATTPSGTPIAGGWGGIEPTLLPGDISGPAYTFEGALEGFYFFSNKVEDANGCSSTSQTIVQVTSAGSAGTADVIADVCELTPACYTLLDHLTGEGTGGTWTTGGTYTTAFISCDPGFFVLGDTATFNTEGMPAGTYTFTYTVTTPNNLYPIYDGCISCTGSTATISITITAAIPAGGGSSQMVCA